MIHKSIVTNHQQLAHDDHGEAALVCGEVTVYMTREDMSDIGAATAFVTLASSKSSAFNQNGAQHSRTQDDSHRWRDRNTGTQLRGFFVVVWGFC